MTWSNVAGGVLQAITVIITAGTPNSGLFAYSGTPAAGNLIASIASADGTDIYGNTYLQGITSYTSTEFAQLWSGALFTGQVTGGIPDVADAGVFTSQSTGVTSITSGFNAGTGNTDAAELFLFSGEGGQTTGNALCPSLVLNDSLNTSAADLYLSGTVIKNNDGGTPYTWQAATITGTGWAIGPTLGTTQNLQYRFDAEDNLVMIGAVHTTTNAPTNPIFTLPAAYRPVTEQRVGCITNAANVATARFVQITASGNVNCFALPSAASTDLQIALTVPMGHIA